MGLLGVAWGTVVPHLICTAVVVPLITLRAVEMSPAEYLRRAYITPVLLSTPTAVLCYVFSAFVARPTWTVFAFEVFGIGTLVAVNGYFLCLSKEQRAATAQRVFRIACLNGCTRILITTAIIARC